MEVGGLKEWENNYVEDDQFLERKEHKIKICFEYSTSSELIAGLVGMPNYRPILQYMDRIKDK